MELDERPRPKGDLASQLADDMAAVNALIVDRMGSQVPLIPQLAGHIVAAGGKRLRPLLTLACAKLYHYTGPRARKLAACVEFIHTATLLHDDVVDESQLRRGGPSANALFGNTASVLVGDFLFSRAFQLMVEDGSLEVLRILSNASAVIAEGEVLQLSTTQNIAATDNDYLNVIRAKTAELFAAACRIGAVITDRPEHEQQTLYDFGLNLGMAFQMIDDVLDYSAEQARLGKTVGDDFAEGKMTLPIIVALQRGTEPERDFWRRTLEKRDQHAGDLAAAQAILQRHNALETVAKRAQHYATTARHLLDIFPHSPLKQTLQNIAEFTVQRGA
ncbi:MAG: polyprenyl synthetase family protein [Alphaproteobacteria bacterium]|nr:polyprenyl synthetase family protein [Alphaproteobacteria bacterium]